MTPQADPAGRAVPGGGVPGSATTRVPAEAAAGETAVAAAGLALRAAAGPGTGPRPVAGIARGAMIIAGFTMLARILGLVRTLVFSQTIGATCLGTAYVTASQVPNLVYELVLGGALTSAMVPVLARSAARAADDPAEKERVSQITSALLTWSVIILVPATIIILLAAGPIASVLNPANASAHCSRPEVVATTGSMLRVFAPQVLLYGLSVVLFGLLQAFRRFTGPALAPMIASLVLIASYLAFVPLGRGFPLARLPLSAQLMLSVGATAGVAALVVVGLVPAWRLHLRIRPVLRFPPGVARRTGGLAIVGVAELVASDVAAVVAIALANGRGDTGAVVIANYTGQVFNSVHAVLALSIALSAFPALSARDGLVFDRTCAGSTRAVLLMSWLGAAVIMAIAVPAAHVLARQPDQVPELVEGFVLYAPGLLAMGLIANLSRVMFVIGRLMVAAWALGGGFLLVAVADVVLVELVPARLVVGALALGSTVGLTVAAIPLVFITRRVRGPAAVQGVNRAALAGLAAAVAGAAVGVGISLVLPMGHKLADAGVAVLAAGGAVTAFGAVAYLLDDGDLRVILARLRKLARLRS
jgi:putative peptidoglycan lipid II flippase